MSSSFDLQVSSRETAVITATGGQTTIAITFPFQSVAELVIHKEAVDGARSTLTSPSGFTATGAGSSAGGTATLVTPATAGEKYRVAGSASIERRSDMTVAGRYNTAALEGDLDKGVIIDAELKRDVGRTVRAHPMDPAMGTLPAKALRTGKRAVFDLTSGDLIAADEIVAATTSVAGLMSAADKTKLDGVAAGATVNSSDAALRDRATHTGSQAIGTVSGLQAALDAKLDDSDATGLLARANHTGTQAIATVSGLQTALDAKLDDGQATATGLAVLGAADKPAARTAIDFDPAARAASLPLPNTLVILGSSNAAGVGATGYSADPVGPGWTEPAASWAGILRFNLSGWTVFNRSVSGSGTAASIARFWTDVAPHRPSHVLLCTSPANDSYNPQTWLQGTRELIRLVRSIGAVPIVRGPSCDNGAGASTLAAIFECQRLLETLDVPLIDALSPLSDPANPGKFIGGATFHTDGLHNSDAGYSILADAIDRNLFRRAAEGTPRTKPQGAWSPDTAANTDCALQVTTSAGLSHALTSFTMRARIGGHASGGSARAFMSAYALTAAGVLRLRNPVANYQLFIDGGGFADTAINPVSDTGVHDLVIVFRAAEAKAYLYLDGVLQGAGLAPGGTPLAVSQFTWGSREAGAAGAAQYYRFADCQLWSVPLSAEAIADMARTGYAPRAGLIFDADMSARPGAAGTRARNIVPNGTTGLIGVAWLPVTNI